MKPTIVIFFQLSAVWICYFSSLCWAFTGLTVNHGICPPRTTSRTCTQLSAEGSTITMPALSSTMKEGRVVTWLKNEGDEIEAGEAIMVVESDKADMDVEAFEDGVLAKILVAEGEMAPVGEAVAIIAESAADVESAVATYGRKISSDSSPKEVKTVSNEAVVVCKCCHISLFT